MAEPRPNLLLVNAHDTGTHVSPYGVRTVDTPNCERLAAESVLFERAFSVAPQCGPSRVSLFTGRYPQNHGELAMGTGHEPDPGVPTLSRCLRDAGYATHHVGATFDRYDGFERFDDEAEVDGREIPGKVQRLLRERDPDRPFFCYVPTIENHRDHGSVRFDKFGVEPDDRLGVTVPPHLRDGPATRADFAGLQGMLRRFDEVLGRILDALDEAGVAGETIVVLTTDHGLDVPLGKCTLRDSGLETMLMARWPGRWGPRRDRGLVSNVDLMPTLLSACKVPTPAGVQGESFLDRLGDPSAPARRSCVFGAMTSHFAYDPMRCVRTGTHKYIRFFEPRSVHSVAGPTAYAACVPEQGDRLWRGDQTRELLYDLGEDPHELRDAAADPRQRGVKAELRRRLHAWLVETGDPILRGPVPSPRGLAWTRELAAEAHGGPDR